eukprot:symbB.v1.2.029643.t1/scaffold3219.1/size60888/2
MRRRRDGRHQAREDSRQDSRRKTSKARRTQEGRRKMADTRPRRQVRYDPQRSAQVRARRRLVPRRSIRDPTGSTSKPVGRHASTDRWVDGRIGRPIDRSNCVTAAQFLRDKTQKTRSRQQGRQKT